MSAWMSLPGPAWSTQGKPLPADRQNSVRRAVEPRSAVVAWALQSATTARLLASLRLFSDQRIATISGSVRWPRSVCGIDRKSLSKPLTPFRSPRNSAMRARITWKSSAARGRSVSKLICPSLTRGSLEAAALPLGRGAAELEYGLSRTLRWPRNLTDVDFIQMPVNKMSRQRQTSSSLWLEPHGAPSSACPVQWLSDL